MGSFNTAFQAALGQSCGERIAGLHIAGPPDHGAVFGSLDDGISPADGGQRAHGLQGAGEGPQALAPALEFASLRAFQALAQFPGTFHSVADGPSG